MFELVYPSRPAPRIPRPNALSTWDEAPISSEMLPVIDETGLVVGQATRAYCHSGSKVLHPVVHLQIIDRYSKIYLQKRGACKDLLPGRWDTAVGGHVSYGETLEEALYREASEELGLTQFNPIYLESYIWQTERDNEHVNIFAAVGNLDIHPDGVEVEEGAWWSMDDIESSIGQGIFTPNFEDEFIRIRSSLLALL